MPPRLKYRRVVGKTIRSYRKRLFKFFVVHLSLGQAPRLANQLGYPVSGETMRTRLQRVLASPADVVFVAKSADGELVGWIHGVLSQFLESDRRVEIGVLVVDERSQRKGIGPDLVARVEAWAVEHGVLLAQVRCQTRRVGAHTFYESLGYSPAKTQTVFRKSLSRQPNTSRV